MPLYEYHCRNCDARFEWLQSHAGDVPSRCTRCGAEAPVRQLSVFAVSSSRPAEPGPCGSSDCACRRRAEH